MANLTETVEWTSGVYQLETTDRVIGGVGGKSNQQAQALANRTAYLKNRSEAHDAAFEAVAQTFELTAPLNSPAFTGNPAAPTQAADNETTRLATTAFVLGQAGSSNPVVNGTAAPGTSKRFSRQDHVHPTDTTRAPVASPTFTGTALVNGDGLGYATGSGGTVTQTTSKSTAVTLNKACGSITLDNANMPAGTSEVFTLTNDKIAATDVVMVCIKSGATANTYRVQVESVAAGSCQISIQNYSASPISEAVVLNFVVIKAVAA